MNLLSINLNGKDTKLTLIPEPKMGGIPLFPTVPVDLPYKAREVVNYNILVGVSLRSDLPWCPPKYVTCIEGSDGKDDTFGLTDRIDDPNVLRVGIDAGMNFDDLMIHVRDFAKWAIDAYVKENNLDGKDVVREIVLIQDKVKIEERCGVIGVLRPEL